MHLSAYLSFAMTTISAVSVSGGEGASYVYTGGLVAKPVEPTSDRTQQSATLVPFINKDLAVPDLKPAVPVSVTIPITKGPAVWNATQLPRGKPGPKPDVYIQSPASVPDLGPAPTTAGSSPTQPANSSPPASAPLPVLSGAPKVTTQAADPETVTLQVPADGSMSGTSQSSPGIPTCAMS